MKTTGYYSYLIGICILLNSGYRSADCQVLPLRQTSGNMNVLSSVVAIGAFKDNSIYMQNQSNSNGAGEVMVAGNNGGGNASRALLSFDIASSIPAGSTITGVTLGLHCSNAPHSGVPELFSLYKLLEDWGEGNSDAGLNAGPGAPAEPGDATWINRFYPDIFWQTVGGSFAETKSAETTVGDVGFYSWSSTGLIADVQNWLDSPTSNYGWIVKGTESGTFQARRFDSRQNVTENFRPVLTITFDPPANSTLTLSSLFLEGLYAGAGLMNKAQDESGNHYAGDTADLLTVELHDASDYALIVYADPTVSLSVSGIAILSIPAVFNGTYYLTVRNRNHISTVSALPVSFASATITYSFDGPAKAFGNNLVAMSGGDFGIYSGDVNQDGIVDSGDMIPVDNLASTFSMGYISEDANGDGLIDSGDMILLDNNSAFFVSSITP